MCEPESEFDDERCGESACSEVLCDDTLCIIGRVSRPASRNATREKKPQRRQSIIGVIRRSAARREMPHVS